MIIGSVLIISQLKIYRRTLWLQRLRKENIVENLQTIRVCSDHFQRVMFSSTGKRLTATALPDWEPIEGLEYASTNSMNDVRLKAEATDLDLFMFFINSVNNEYQNIQTAKMQEALVSPGEDTENVPPLKRRKIEILSDIRLPDLAVVDMASINEQSPSDIYIPQSSIASTQTEKKLSLLTPRKMKLKQENKVLKESIQEKNKLLRKYENPNQNEQQFLNSVHEKLPKELAYIVESYIKNKGKDKKGRRYTEEVKQFAFSVYFLAPTAYTFLTKAMHLPAEITLQKCASSWPSGPGLKDIYFNALKLKGEQLPHIAKKCSIVMDEMSVKACLQFSRKTGGIIGLVDDGITRENAIARNVFVIMAQGITVEFKHFQGYAFIESSYPAQKVKNIVFDAIKRLKDIG